MEIHQHLSNAQDGGEGVKIEGILIGGGKGSRLGAGSYTSKPMVIAGGRPLYTYGMDILKALGCYHITALCGDNFDFADSVKDRYTEVDAYVGPPQGIVADIAALAPYKGDFVAMIFADEYVRNVGGDGWQAWMKRFSESVWHGESISAFLAYVRGVSVADVRKTYALLVDADDDGISPQIVQRLIEKPVKPYAPRIGTGFAVARADALNLALGAVDADPSRFRNWVDIWQWLVDAGHWVVTEEFEGPYFNVNTPEDLEALTTYLRGK